MRKKRQHTSAKQLIAWLHEGQVNAGHLAQQIEKAVERSKPGTVALRRLVEYDESLAFPTYRRNRKSRVEEYREKCPYEAPNPPKSACEFMERQWERESARERQYRESNSFGKKLSEQINEAMGQLEEAGLV